MTYPRSHGLSLPEPREPSAARVQSPRLSPAETETSLCLRSAALSGTLNGNPGEGCAPPPGGALTSSQRGSPRVGAGLAHLIWRPTLLLRPDFRAGCQGRPDKRCLSGTHLSRGCRVTATRAGPARLGLCPPRRRGHGCQEEPRPCTAHPPTPSPVPPPAPAQAPALGGAGGEGRARRGTRLAQARAPSPPQSPAPGRQCRGPGGNRTSVFPPCGLLALQMPSSCYTPPRPPRGRTRTRMQGGCTHRASELVTTSS